MDNFKWDEETVKEALHVLSMKISEHNSFRSWLGIDKEIEAFKESKKLKPLFKDVLGNNIFYGDKFYSVTDDFEILYSDAVNGTHLAPQIISRSYLNITDAEQYILENKPCISLKDLYSMCHYITSYKIEFSKKELEELIQSKLKS